MSQNPVRQVTGIHNLLNEQRLAEALERLRTHWEVRIERSAGVSPGEA
jgi:hypothetical protein